MLQTFVENDAILFMEKGLLAAIHRTIGGVSMITSHEPPVEPPTTTFNESDARISAHIANDRTHLFDSHVDAHDVPMNLEVMRRIARRAGVVKITYGALQLYWNRLVNSVAYVTAHAVVRLIELSKDAPETDDDDDYYHAAATDTSGASDDEDKDSDDASTGGWSSEDEEVSENEPWIQRREISHDDDLATMIQKELDTIYSPPEAFLVAAVQQLQRDNSGCAQACYGRSTVAHSDADAAATDGWSPLVRLDSDSEDA